MSNNPGEPGHPHHHIVPVLQGHVPPQHPRSTTRVPVSVADPTISLRWKILSVQVYEMYRYMG